MDNKIRIMIVEDERIAAEDLRLCLEGFGFQVVAVVASGIQALKRASQIQIDLVLMDIVLKDGKNGIETAIELKDRYGLPVIYLTAYSDPYTIEHVKKSQPYGYIHKPFDFKELQVVIETALYKHQMETKLKEREEWFSTTIKSILDGVITLDKKGRITLMNSASEKLTGWTHSESLGRPIEQVFKIINEDTQKAIENPARQVIHRGNLAGLFDHTVLIAKGGKRIPIDYSGAPIYDERKKIIGIVLVFKDITEKRKNQKEITSLSKFPKENPNPILRMEKSGKLLYANPASSPLLEIWKCRVGHHVPDSIKLLAKRAITNGFPIFADLRIGEKVFSFNVVPVPGEDYVNLYGRDVTLQKQVEVLKEKHLHDQMVLGRMARLFMSNISIEELFHFLGEILQEVSGADYLVISRYNPDTQTATLVSMRGFEKVMRPIQILTGIDPRLMSLKIPRMLPKRIKAFTSGILIQIPNLYELAAATLPRDLCSKIEKRMNISEIFEMGFVWRKELLGGVSFLYKTKGGMKNRFLIETFVNQSAIYLLRKKAEIALRVSEKRFMDIVKIANEGIWEMDEYDKTTFINQRMADILGYAVEEMMELSYSDFIVPEDRADYKQRMKERRKGKPGRYKIRLKCKDGSVKRMRVSATPITNENGRFIGSLGMFLEITEKKNPI